MHPGLIRYITDTIGHTNWMANVGGAITSHPSGTAAGVRAMAQSVTKNYGIEYETAIKKWGLKK
jgi:ribulose 1,5-bisphosphate carboxylase large subunit-like protein